MAEEAVLRFLEKNDEISDSGKFAVETGLTHDEIVNVIKSLSAFSFVDAQDIKRERWALTDEGNSYAANGSPEVQLFLAVPSDGISREELQKKLNPSIFKIGCQQAIKNKWIEMGKTQVSRKVEHVHDKVKELLLQFQTGEAVNLEDIDALKRRKLIIPQVWKGFSVKKGPNYAPERKKAATDLTRENLQKGDWKELEFKGYNFSAKGLPLEVERQSAAIRALRDVEIEQLGNMIQILRSYFNKEQLKIPALQFFKDDLQNLSIGVTEDGNFQVQSKHNDNNAQMVMDDERNLQSALFHQISTVYGDRAAAVPSFGGFGFSNETVKTSVFGVENLHIRSFDLEDALNNQPYELQDGLQTPNASNLGLSVGMTPKTLRLPKPGEMLLSVHGSPLGVFNEEKMEAIQESEDC